MGMRMDGHVVVLVTGSHTRLYGLSTTPSQVD